ncbi:hypothetical protein L5I01_25890 [Gordonia sp. HY442]|uniref:hypothetical protein n=1 Tax=Gordonia zhenghanii TaxID=2911516 RepID=UPI001F1EAF64|nr:hypothetical protein [Gordonia zhenghanii]MCF8606790.1 hypothetical protein [Gordonia zhenghanii]
MSDTQNISAVPLLSAILAAQPAQVAETLAACTPRDVELVDEPAAAILEVVAELAASGRTTTAETVSAELLRRGMYEGHHGDLIKGRMIDAASPQYAPEMIPELGSALLATVLRARLQAAGEALVSGAPTAPEVDLWNVLLRAGTQIRELRSRLASVRGEAVTA